MAFKELEAEFPQQADLITRLRLDDAQLDEICDDYELLLSDYRQLSVAAVPASPSRLADIEESLGGLLEEIADTLEQGTARVRDRTSKEIRTTTFSKKGNQYET